MSSIDAVMDANDITTYTPDLVPDTEITVPDVVYNSEAVQVANTRPFSSICAVDDADIDAMIDELVTELEPPVLTPSVAIIPKSPWTSDAQAITITNNGDVSLNVISLPDFISKPTLPYALGIGDSLNVNVTSNVESATRYGTISMEYADASGATIPYIAQVSQQGSSLFLKLNDNDGDINVTAQSAAGITRVSVYTNGSAIVSGYTGDFITSATIIGAYVQITCTENNTPAVRTGTVTVSLEEDASISHTINLSQDKVSVIGHATLSPAPPYPSTRSNITMTNDGGVDLTVVELPYYMVPNDGSIMPFIISNNESVILDIYANNSGSQRSGDISMTYKLNGDTKTYSLPVPQDEGELRQVIVVAPSSVEVTTAEYTFDFIVDYGAENFYIKAPFRSDSKAYISFEEILMQSHVDLDTYVEYWLRIDCTELGLMGEVEISASGDLEVELN